MSQSYSSKINKIIRDHSFEKVSLFYRENKLSQLTGVGRKTELELIKFFEEDLDYRLHEILSYFNINQNDKIYKNIITADINYIYPLFKWCINLRYFGKQKESKLFNFCIEKKNNITKEDIKEDPMLLSDILDIKFNEIDRISIDNNFWDYSSYYRLTNYILYLFDKHAKDGHLFFTDNDFSYFMKEFKDYHKKTNTLEISEKLIKLYLKSFVDENIILKIKINNKKGWCLKKNYDIEEQINNNLKKLNFHKDISYDYNTNLSLHENQLDAVKGCLNNNISVISGGPGTGKTSVVLRLICENLVKNEKKILFLAPTHAAKKRGYDELITKNEDQEEKKILDNNMDFQTIHSVIYKYPRYDKDNDEENLNSKLDEYLEYIDYIIIDETSMITSNQLYKLLNTVVDSGKLCSIIFVGDSDQLPPIGMGNPFHDMIDIIPVFKLTKNYRANKSDIPLFLEKVNSNGATLINKKSDNYIFKNKYKNIHQYFNKDFMEELKTILTKFKNEKIVQYEGIDKDKTFQIVCPFNKTITNFGIIQLVRKMFFNIDSDNLFEKKDVIIMNKNIKDIFTNGDYAKIIDIKSDEYSDFVYFTIKLLYNKEKILKEKCNDNNITISTKDNNFTIKINKNYIDTNSYFKPSYAISVHKSQGLSFNNVITIYNQFGQSGFINKKLNYTAFSRAKDKVYLLGEQKYYINNDDIERNTLIKYFYNDNIKILSERKEIKLKEYINDTSPIINEIKNKRKHIPKKVKEDVFRKRNGEKFKGKCYVCKDKINITNFHVGHVKSVMNGGNNNIENLEPICPGCNLSMGSQNMEFYIEEFYKKNT